MTTKRTIEEWGKRYLVLCVGLWIMSLGVACSIKGALGTSPISSLPYAMSGFLPLTVGTCTIIMHVGFILLQILILRRQYDPMQLIQLPVALLFGYLTDFALWAVDWLQCTAYWQQWLVCLAGICLVAVGVSCEVFADVAVLAGEGVVLAVCKVAPVQFSAHEGDFRCDPGSQRLCPLPGVYRRDLRRPRGYPGRGSSGGDADSPDPPPYGEAGRLVYRTKAEDWGGVASDVTD